jgi:tetratricopeptide (TPR) repeat protein
MTAAVARAMALHAEGHAAVANMRPVDGARLLRSALSALGDPPSDPELRGRVLVSLAYAEVELGHVDLGWQLLAEAEGLLPPHARGLLHNQRALLHIRTGRDEAAIVEYGLALAVLREETDARDLARAYLNRGNLQLMRGRLREARTDLRRCAEVSKRHELDRILPMAEHSLGYVAYLAGDLPAALHAYREVAGRYAVVKPGLLPVVAVDRAKALTAAGLLAEADEQLAYALAEFKRHRLQQDHAEALLARAENALSAGAVADARRWASAARREFLRRDNRRWAAVAALVALRARPPAGRSGGARLAAEARELAGTLARLGLAEQSRQATLIAARAGTPQPPILALGESSRNGHGWIGAEVVRPPRGDRLETQLLWRLARAEHAQAAGRPAEAMWHLAAGMAHLQRRRTQLGSLDLQTGAAVHGREIAAAGLAAALRDGSVAAVHRWSELSRAQALLLPPATPPSDPGAAAALEELRQVRDGIRAAELSGRPVAELRARAARLERGIREQSWTAAGLGAAARPAPLSAVRSGLGAAALVALVRHGRWLLALVVTERRTKILSLGDFTPIEESVRRLRADLDARAGRALTARMDQAITAATRRDAAAVAATLVEPLLPLVGDRDLVVVPTGTLVATPWGALPGCAGRALTVAPSSTAWLAARRRLDDARRGAHVALIAGPGNDLAETEVRAIAQLYRHPRLLTGPDATPAATAKVLAGAGLAHVAAHGRHEPQNALFSSLDLAGGPLMGYDLQRLDAAPAVVVLAACDVGLADVRPGDETIGMTAALLAAGTSTVIAGVGRVADQATITVMTGLHRALRAGRTPAAALAEAAGGTAFVCFGAG